MKLRNTLIASLPAIALVAFVGCQSGMCTNCGAGYNGFPATGYQQPPATWTSPQGATIQPPPGTVIQPSMTTAPPMNTVQPGVVLPQQVAPVQSQPGMVYGTGQ